MRHGHKDITNPCGYCGQKATATVDAVRVCPEHYKNPPEQIDRIEAMIRVIVNRGGA